MSANRYSEQERAFYRAYINSPQWRARKNARIEKAGRRCEWETLLSVVPEVKTRCTRARYLCVHHNTYERLGAEIDSDLDVYCWFHHYLEHLLWKKCVMCTQPCLENEVLGARWFETVLISMGIDLDNGPVNWNVLPNKEVFLEQVPVHCPTCAEYLSGGRRSPLNIPKE